MTAPVRVRLDGSSLKLAEIAAVARDPRARVELAPDALERVAHVRRQVERLVEQYVAPGSDRVPNYGITTGFGEFKSRPVGDPARPDELRENLLRLQRNILLSHCVGVGENAVATDLANYFPAEVVRATLLIRLNTFLKGHSGVRVETVRTVQAMLERGIIPLVPLRGSVGSSGDLCPLAHLFAVLIGEGQYYVVQSPEQLADPRPALLPAARIAEALGRAPEPPSYKEGLALTNGATFSAALLALAAHDAEVTANAADVALALSLEATCGAARAFDARVHASRNQTGQAESAANVRALIEGSRLIERAGDVQDAYSLRCAPAVHGAARDAVGFARMIAEREVNAATDNPLLFPGPGDLDHDGDPFDLTFAGADAARARRKASYSAGNFHGQPVGLAADALAIAVAELGNISERRTQTLLDANHNRGLPSCLTALGGLNSGMMIAQYAAAGVVSENKVLCHPASVDSIPTSSNAEDHVAMATIAARKLRTVLGNVQAVLAIELLCAAQAIEWRVAMHREPLLRHPGVGTHSDPRAWASAVEERDAFRAATAPELRAELAAQVGRGTAAAYAFVRELAEPLVDDRPLDGDIRKVRAAVGSGELTRVVEGRVRLRRVAVLGVVGEPD